MTAAVAPPPHPHPTPLHRHHHQDDDGAVATAHHTTSFPSPPTTSSTEEAYAILIRTYLSLLCHDNATFLAERNAASYPHSADAIYLLAYCHYRSGCPKSARGILVNRWPGRNDLSSSSSSSSSYSPDDVDVDDDDDDRTSSAAVYLLAKSCYDLGLYGEAEEALLGRCRYAYSRATTMAPGGDGHVGGDREGGEYGDNHGGGENDAMDEWIVRASTTTKPTSDPAGASSRYSRRPVPNGAAGMYLLGNICRKTNRRRRAIEYYRMSLRIDPLMWTSYEAMCEIGGGGGGKGSVSGGESASSSSDEEDDPNSIFGVPAPKSSMANRDDALVRTAMIPCQAGSRRGLASRVGGGKGEGVGGGGGVDGTMDDPTIIAGGGDDDDIRLQSSESRYGNKPNRYGTPSTPYTGFGRMNIGSYTDNTRSAYATERSRGANYYLPAATSSTEAPRGREGRRGDRGDSLPHANLFAATPAIVDTPCPTTMTPLDNDIDDDVSPSASAIGYANRALDRARRVVAGLAYEPSPESVDHRDIGRNHNNPTTQRKLRFATELTFSSTPMTAYPNTRRVGGGDDDDGDASAPFHAGVSTVKGEKRALFSQSDALDGDGEDVRKKSPKKEYARKEETTQTTQTTKDAGRTSMTPGVVEDMKTESEHVRKILELLCGLGAAYKCLCQYRSRDALELFRELPSEQINTGWVLHQMGKAYFEMSDYQNAERALQTMRRVEPHRIKGLDILSTTLWQLKKEVELSDLAQQVVGFDRMKPEAWFVVGNCFSLQKEHETAITFFRRSIQLNPSYTYAHTLCGHEFTSNEDFEKAISCYRDAIRVDSRHYNAWYGLGAIYFRQEKFELAEYHFQRALDINSQSSVLHCHLGMAQHQNGKTMEALDTLSGAFRLDPRNPQAHYQRATIFMSLDRPRDALLELEKVRSAAPKESSVHFNMGKVYKRLGQPSRAMRCFLTALDLDPKDNNLIKAAMDRLDEPDLEDEVSVF